jgi:flagellar hook-length control protein FliK
MSTVLFFSQPIPQNPSTGIRSDQIGSVGLDRSAKIRTTDESPKGDGDNFLSTLKQVSQDRNPTKRSQHTAEAPLSKTTASVGGGEIDETSDPETSPADIPTQTEPDAQPDQMVSEWNFAAFIKVLENMGFHDAAGGSDLQNMADANPVDNNQMDAIKSLIARLQHNQFELTADLKAGLERLQQFLANAPMPIDGTSGQGLSSNQRADLAQINQWLKGMTPGLQDQNGNSGLLMGEGTAGVKPPGAIAAEAGTGIETAVKSLAMNGGHSGTATFQSTENSAALSQSEIRTEVDPKSATDSQPIVAKNEHGSKAAPAVESTEADASKIKEPLGFGRDPRTANRTEVPGRMATTPDPDQRAGTANMRDNQSVKSSASSSPDPAVVKMSESQIQSTSGEEPLSKVFQETQRVKEGVVKVESGFTEETVSKVIKTEAGSNDNGLLNSSGHNTEKSAEPAAIQKETEARQSDLRNQTMDQIVRKAAIHLRNGQHEARIELKPDFLGHIRMQVISENHLVTVKILAQHGFVKDMIESNVHQLKADLQQQGLEVGKLEVSVSRDSEDSGNFKDKFAQSKARQNPAGHQNEDHSAQEQQGKTPEPVRTADGATTVDYFA